MFNFIEFRKLIRSTELLPDERFDMTQWKSSCGTVGCAIGSYCDMYPNSKLQLMRDPSIQNMFYPTINGEHSDKPHQIVGDFFNITEEQAKYLFSPTSYRNDSFPFLRIKKQEVLDRIKKFYTDKILEYHKNLPKKTLIRELVTA